MKVCLIRLDKIGDLVSTLPVDQADVLGAAEARWVISLGLGFIPSNSIPGRRFLQLNKNNKWESFRAFRKFLKEEKFDVAVSFQAPWWISLALWLAGVKVRAGVKSQWHSFLFLNRGLRQRRSLAQKHEADYNLDLLSYALKQPAEPPAPVLRMRAPALEDFQSRLALTPQSYVVVHPGMAGSALNWPQKNYVTLVRELSLRRLVVITGTPADEPWLTEIRNGLRGEANVRWLVGEAGPNELLGVLENARAVIAPSTGVAHLAAALGRPVIALFSPLKVQMPVRWAPRGPDVQCLVPTGLDPKTPGLLDPKSENYCMLKITVDDVLKKTERHL